MIRNDISHVEHRHQRLSAGEEFGVLETAEQLDRLGKPLGPMISKVWGFHFVSNFREFLG